MYAPIKGDGNTDTKKERHKEFIEILVNEGTSKVSVIRQHS